MTTLYFALAHLVADRNRKDDEGATAVEYGLMVALIAAVIVTVVALVGDQVQNAFQSVVDAIAGETGGAAGTE